MEKWKCFIHIQRNKFTKPPFLEAKKISRNFRFPIFFLGSKLAKMKTLLCKWHIAIKTYLINLFDLLLKNLTSQSKCLQKSRFCECVPLDMNETFSFTIFRCPRVYTLFKKYGIWLGQFFLYFGRFWEPFIDQNLFGLVFTFLNQ